MKKNIFFILVVMSSSFSFAKDAHSDLFKVWNSDKVACMVGKAYIRSEEFEAHYLSQRFDQRSYSGPEWDASEKARDEIYGDTSIYGDCALVQLLNDFDDASVGENIEYYITSRGKRMVPILELLMKYPLHHLEAEAEKNRIKGIESLIDAIKAGKTLGVSQEYGNNVCPASPRPC